MRQQTRKYKRKYLSYHNKKKPKSKTKRVYGGDYGGELGREDHGGKPRSKKVSMKSLSRNVKKEACSPYAKKRNSIKGSCFTDGNLVDLKNTYNRKHPNNQIKTNNPVQIWKQLAKKTKEDYECNKESSFVFFANCFHICKKNKRRL